jgi:hypothetical protein
MVAADESDLSIKRFDLFADEQLRRAGVHHCPTHTGMSAEDQISAPGWHNLVGARMVQTE